MSFHNRTRKGLKWEQETQTRFSRRCTGKNFFLSLSFHIQCFSILVLKMASSIVLTTISAHCSDWFRIFEGERSDLLETYQPSQVLPPDAGFRMLSICEQGILERKTYPSERMFPWIPIEERLKVATRLWMWQNFIKLIVLLDLSFQMEKDVILEIES